MGNYFNNPIQVLGWVLITTEADFQLDKFSVCDEGGRMGAFCHLARHCRFVFSQQLNCRRLQLLGYLMLAASDPAHVRWSHD